MIRPASSEPAPQIRELSVSYDAAASVQILNAAPLPQITTNSSTWGDFVGSFSNLPYPTESTVLTVSAVYACVNLIAGAIAMLPMDIMRRDLATGELDKIHNDPLWWVFNEEMTPRWGAPQAWEFITQNMLLHGDGFARILRNVRAEPTGLEPIHPTRVTVVLNPANKRLIYGIAPEPLMQGNFQDQWAVLDQDDMIHVPGPGFNGFRGLSPLRHSLRMAGAVALATQDHTANFFANSARPDFALGTDQTVTPDVVDYLKKMLAENHGGSGNAHKPMILGNGLKIQTFDSTNEDSQLLATRQFSIEEIARIYGVPPFLIGHNEKTTSFGTGIESIGQAFVRYTLGRHIKKFEKEFNRKLFRTAARVAVFDVTEFERADMKSLFEAYRIAIGRAGEPGFMSTREVRTRIGLKKEPDGQLNLGLPLPAPKGKKKHETAAATV